MEINTNYIQTNTYTQTSTKNDESETSFDNYMNTNDDNDSQTTSSTSTSSTDDYIEVSDTTNSTTELTYSEDLKSEETVNLRGKFIQDVDTYFPTVYDDLGISTENEEIFRSILSDSNISDGEIQSLDFEQTEQLASLINTTLQDDMGMVDFGDRAITILFSTTFSGDKNLNEALYTTFKDDLTMTRSEMATISGSLFHNISQAYSSEELGLGIYSSPATLLNMEEFKEIELDFSALLIDMLDITSEKLKIEKIEDTKERVEVIDNAYREILKNYNEFKSEN